MNLASLAGVLLLALGLSACDPAPIAQLTNNSGQSVLLRSVTVNHGVYDSGRKQDATVAPGKTIRFFPWESIRLRAGRCELVYAVPDLPLFVGLVLPFDIQPDRRLYLRGLKGDDLKFRTFALDAQPAGWPLDPVKAGCP